MRQCEKRKNGLIRLNVKSLILPGPALPKIRKFMRKQKSYCKSCLLNFARRFQSPIHQAAPRQLRRASPSSNPAPKRFSERRSDRGCCQFAAEPSAFARFRRRNHHAAACRIRALREKIRNALWLFPAKDREL